MTNAPRISALCAAAVDTWLEGSTELHAPIEPHTGASQSSVRWSASIASICARTSAAGVVALCFVVGWLLGYPALRVQHHYLAFVTLAFSTLAYLLFRIADTFEDSTSWPRAEPAGSPGRRRCGTQPAAPATPKRA